MISDLTIKECYWGHT